MKVNRLNSRRILEKIEGARDELSANDVKKIGLFGSYLKNKQKRGSDVDILVEIDKPTFDKYTEVLILLEKILRKKIDLVIESDLLPELKYVKKEAKYVRL